MHSAHSTSRTENPRPLDPTAGIFLTDLDWTGVDSDDLGKLMRELPIIINLIDEMAQYSPFVRQSAKHPSCTENTALGETLSDLQKWLQYQLEEAHQGLRCTPATLSYSEDRALDLVAHMARQTGDLADIAAVALTLNELPTAALPRKQASWVKRYLAERKTHV